MFENPYPFLRESSKIGLVFARQYSSLEGWLGLWLPSCVLVNTCFFLGWGSIDSIFWFNECNEI